MKKCNLCKVESMCYCITLPTAARGLDRWYVCMSCLSDMMRTLVAMNPQNVSTALLLRRDRLQRDEE